MTLDHSPPPPTQVQIWVYAAATSLCLVEAGEVPADSIGVQKVAFRILQVLESPGIPAYQALPIWQAAIEATKDPDVCPMLLRGL